MSSAFTASQRGGSGPPLACLHGFTDTWRTWELVLPALERHHDVLAPTLAGHAGGPPLDGDATGAALADAVERAMDEAGFPIAHIAGNSLGGYVALELAARGRAKTVVALAPAGGWAERDESHEETLDRFVAIARPPAARRGRLPRLLRVDRQRAPRGLAARSGEHRLPGASRVGTEDRLLPWPASAARFRRDWLPHADWVELEGVGHCPQLDVPLETAQLILGFTSS